jgi:hypothetical protein
MAAVLEWLTQLLLWEEKEVQEATETPNTAAAAAGREVVPLLPAAMEVRLYSAVRAAEAVAE